MANNKGLSHVLAASVLVAFVAGCAETKRSTPTAKRPQGADETVVEEQGIGQGIYKIGTPYRINGVWYYPAPDYSYSETGIASWYGEEFDGRPTANGEVYDMGALTAAHRTLPLPSLVQVTNLENGRSLVLRVNDRGPFARGRIIDVSRRAAELLGFYGKGTAKVRVDILAEESLKLAVLAQGRTPELAAAPEMPAVPRGEVVREPLPGSESARVVSVAAFEGEARANGLSPGPMLFEGWAPERTPDGVVTVREVKPSRIYVQAGAFLKRENADRLRSELSWVAGAKVTPQRIGDQRFYRVRLGPLADVLDADFVLEKIAAKGHTDARIVVE